MKSEDMMEQPHDINYLSDLSRLAEKIDHASRSRMILEKASKNNFSVAFKPSLKERRRRVIKDQVRKMHNPNMNWPSIN